MTAPLPDDPLDWGPVERHERGFVRELAGLLAVIVGLVTIGALLATVDTRWVIGLGGVVLIVAGLWLGRRPDNEVS